MKILLTIDMQNDFIDGSLGTAEAKNILNSVINEMSAFEGDIICTRDTHGKDYLETQEGLNLPIEHCIEYTDGWKLNDKIELIARDKKAVFINKRSFGSKDLPEYLEKAYGDTIESIEIIGLCTDICVISNALILKSFLPETPIEVKADCCAGVTPESHEIALAAMKACHINIV